MCAGSAVRVQHVRELQEAPRGQGQAVNEAGEETDRSSEASEDTLRNSDHVLLAFGVTVWDESGEQRVGKTCTKIMMVPKNGEVRKGAESPKAGAPSGHCCRI